MMMPKIKTLAYLVLILLVGLTSCDTKDPEKEAMREQLRNLEEKNQEDSLYIADLTSEMDVIYDKLDSMQEKEREIKALAADLRGGNINASEGGMSISETMKDIQAQLEQSRNQIRDLEARLASEGKDKQKYIALVQQLRKVVEQKDANIVTLQEDIGRLQDEVKGLKLDYAVKQVEADSLQDVSNLQDEALNTAFYVIGSEKELKGLNLLVSKKKGLEGNRDQSKYISIDIREQKIITIGNVKNLKKVKLVPARPESSYRLYEDGDQAKLEIKDIDAFWQDKYLAIVSKMK